MVFRSPSPVPRAATFAFQPSPSALQAVASASVGGAGGAIPGIASADMAPALAAPSVPSAAPFDKEAARAAVEGLAPRLAECKLPKGRPVRIKVTFSPDGRVTSAAALAPVVGRQAACVASRAKEVQVGPFEGPAVATFYSVVIR